MGTAMVRLLPRRSGVGVIEVKGIIGANTRASVHHELLDKLERDPRVGSVVLDIDSPGGGVAASEDLFLKVKRLREKKPVVAFIRGTGASGSYLVACAATRIIALPSAIVGSIGVISLRPVAAELLERLGINISVSKSGPLKDMGAFYRAPTDEERGKLQGLIDELYKAFVGQVAESRNMKPDVVRGHATGEVFTGRRGRELGLVDELGDFDATLDMAAYLGRVPRRAIHVRPPHSFRQRMLGQFTMWAMESVLEGTGPSTTHQLWYL